MTNIKILIVEDEKTTASILKMLLHKWGYDTHQAFSAKEALSIFRQEKIDMAVVDINIGDAVDGVELSQEFAKIRRIPIIYMTGSDAPEDIKRAKKTNPTAYLLKPIDKRSLEISIDLALYNYYPTLMSEGDMTMHIANKRNSTKFFLKNGDVIFLKQSYHFVKLPIEDIIYLEADGNYTKIITAQQKFLVRLGISTVLEQFNADYLIKINRAQAINIRHLLSFNEVDITLIGKKEFALSKAYKENFLAKFETL